MLHQYISLHHALIYAVKRERIHTQNTLSSKVNKEIQKQRTIVMDGTTSLIRLYISKLHGFSPIHCRLGGNVTTVQLFTLLKDKIRKLIDSHPI